MGDVLEAVSARIKAPYFGYAVLAFLAWNWRGIFLLVMTEGTPEQRLAAFDAHTTLWSLYVAPLLTGLFVAASAEWISFCFEWVSRKPLHLKVMQRLEAEHQQAIEKIELEKLRDAQFARKEQELIERAKRDEEVQEIENQEVKQKLQVELGELRSEKDQRDSLGELDESYSPSHFASKLLREAAELDGKIVNKADGFGWAIRAGSFQILKAESPREYSRYFTALRELHSRDFVNETYDGVYEITEKGWSFLDFSEESF